jgi:hypothetical protein
MAFRDWDLTMRVASVTVRDEFVIAIAEGVSRATITPELPIRDIWPDERAAEPTIQLTVRSWDASRSAEQVIAKAEVVVRAYAEALDVAALTIALRHDP